MTPKDLIINFFYLVFLLALVAGAIVFFIEGDRFAAFAMFLKSAWPIAFVLASLAFKLRLTQAEKVRGDKTGNNLKTLNLSFGDKMKNEFIAFALALVVLLVAALSESGVTAVTIVQAIFVLAIAYAWQKYIWFRAR